jgi:hypothetical protein
LPGVGFAKFLQFIGELGFGMLADHQAHVFLGSAVKGLAENGQAGK